MAPSPLGVEDGEDETGINISSAFRVRPTHSNEPFVKTRVPMVDDLGPFVSIPLLSRVFSRLLVVRRVETPRETTAANNVRARWTRERGGGWRRESAR